jgi:predicted Zn-dependent protease
LIVFAALVWCGIGVAQSDNASQVPAADPNSQAVVIDHSSQVGVGQSDGAAPLAIAQTDGATGKETSAEGSTDVAKSDEGALDPANGSPLTPALAVKPTGTLAPPPPPVTPANPEPAKYDVTMIGHRNIGNGLNFYSIEREISIGHDLARQVEQSSRVVTDPIINDYVNRIGQNLVRNSDSRVPFTIKVLDTGEVNAFALPGGFFYVDSGLILAADSESELAAVMAHEIAHVAARHATKNMTKQQIWNMATIPLMFVGGPAAYAIAEIASIAVPLSFLKFSRDAEREADMLGLQYDYAAGYDPQAFIQFFERLKAEEKQKHSKISKMFSTHPMTADRITAAQDEIRTYFPDRDSYVVDTSEFEAVKAHLIALQGGLRLSEKDGVTRPVLRKHAQDEESGNTSTAKTGTQNNSSGQPQDQNDDGPPTLKRTSTNPN